MTDRELLQQALDALNALTKELLACRDELAERGARPETPHKQKLWDSAFNAYIGMAIPTYESIRARLAQPEPEPVAWMRADKGHIGFHKVAPSGYVPLYTAPPKKEWVGLTDVEMLVAAFQAGFDVHEDFDNEDDPDTLHWWSEDGEPCDDTLHKLRNIIEAKLKDKNI